MDMKDFTIIHNPLLRPSRLSINARYLLCVLIRYCGSKDTCYPTQSTLASDLGISVRQLTFYLNELIREDLVSKKRTGFNKPNTYTVAKHFDVESEAISQDRKTASKLDRQSTSAHLRSTLPLNTGSHLQHNNTYVIAKDNNGFNKASFEKFRKDLIAKKLIHDKQNILRKNDSKTQKGNLAEVLQKKNKELTFKRETVESSSEKNNVISGSVNSPSNQKDGCSRNHQTTPNKTGSFSTGRVSKIDGGRAVHKICSN